MRRISLREANQNFSGCVAEVENGERFIVLRRGRPVAEIIPFSGKRVDPKREAARKELITIMKKGLRLGGTAPTRDEMHER